MWLVAASNFAIEMCRRPPVFRFQPWRFRGESLAAEWLRAPCCRRPRCTGQPLHGRLVSLVSEARKNKTDVINDPIGLTHNPISSDHYSHLKFDHFCVILKSRDIPVHTYDMCENSDDYRLWWCVGRVDQHFNPVAYLRGQGARAPGHSSQGGAKLGEKLFEFFTLFVAQKFSHGFATGRAHLDIEISVGCVCNDGT